MKLQTSSFVPHDRSMTKRYLSKKQFAARVGMADGELASYEKSKSFPKPDVIVGEGPRATRGWTEKSIDAWNESRPGSGNWGPKSPARRKK